MSQKIGVVIIHGIGKPEPQFADGMIQGLRKRLGTIADDVVMKPVLWAPVLQEKENELWERLGRGATMDYLKLRRFMIDFAADAIAYQPTTYDHRVYEGIHGIVADAIRRLAQEVGPTAPLCVIAHSLGTVIASNYIYDLQVDAIKYLISEPIRSMMGTTPFDRGETLASVYTLGSPIAIWSLRYPDFGLPIIVPAPQLSAFHQKVSGEWINFYDPDDIIGYPLKSVNVAYQEAVTEDRKVNVGGWLASWNPASHIEYWTDRNVINPIADSLTRIWRQVNQ